MAIQSIRMGINLADASSYSCYSIVDYVRKVRGTCYSYPFLVGVYTTHWGVDDARKKSTCSAHVYQVAFELYCRYCMTFNINYKILSDISRAKCNDN